jgi:hypothetical protein
VLFEAGVRARLAPAGDPRVVPGSPSAGCAVAAYVAMLCVMTAVDESLEETMRLRRRRRARWRAAAVAGVVLALLVLAYVAADHGLGGGGGRNGSFATGVRGTVWREPLAPAGAGGSPMAAAPNSSAAMPDPSAAADSPGTPIAALVQIRDTYGNALGAVTSDDDGAFEAELPPGTYVLIAVSPIDTALPVSEPVTVVVREGEVTTARLTLPAASGPALAISPEPLP